MSAVGVLVTIVAYSPPGASFRKTVTVGSPITTTPPILYVPSTALQVPSYVAPFSTTTRTEFVTPSHVPPVSAVTPASVNTVPAIVITKELSSHRTEPGSPESLSFTSPSRLPELSRNHQYEEGVPST